MTPREQRHALYAGALNAAPDKKAKKAVMRKLALGDVFFLLVYVLHRDDVDRDWLYERCMEVQREPYGHLDLWARAHYKSTIITFAATIQEILRNPEITVGIFSATRPLAKGFLRQIKREFETNTELQEMFDDVLYQNPQKEASKWSEDDGIIVKRRSNPKEATIEAWGLVDGQPTSRHYQLVVYDDVIVQDFCTSPDMIMKVRMAWELSLNLASENGRRKYVGTRYHYNDTYQTIIDRQAAIPRIYPAEVNGKPVFLAVEQIAEKRREMGPYTYGAQMMLDPKLDSVIGFKDDDLRYWMASHYNGMNLYLFCDPANEKKKKSDYTTMWIIGLGADQNYYVVNIIRDRLNLTERADRLFAWHRIYRPLAVFYEQYGMQSDIAHYNDRMQRDNYRFNITPVAGQMSKQDRIMRLLPLFTEHRVWLPNECMQTNYEGITEDLTRVFVNDEYKAFPYMAHDDMLDCLARITDPEVITRMWFPDLVQDSIYGNIDTAVIAEAIANKQAQTNARDGHPLRFRHTR